LRHVKEFRTDPGSDLAEGSVLTVEMLNPGDQVQISGVSKGRGFQGVVKRWGFKGGKASHGAENHRRPGSIGNSADPSRTIKNKKMPGRMGARNITVKNLEIIKVDTEKNLICVKGAVPGHRNGLLTIIPRQGSN
jgi:large subunit ribosomal protein L3